jgi:hypothetical protein
MAASRFLNSTGGWNSVQNVRDARWGVPGNGAFQVSLVEATWYNMVHRVYLPAAGQMSVGTDQEV